MKKNLGTAFGILIVIVGVLGTLIVSMAAEIGVLLLVGIQYDHWSNLIWLIIIYGVIEFVIIMFVDALIEGKSENHQKFHKFFSYTIVSFILIMAVSFFLDSIYLPVTGAVIFAIATAAIYLLFSLWDKKDVSED
ncbi:histidine kinase [Psychrobacillus sp. MER TA 171]|uniref:histidine kinase n=1 Tax=Psychrobacillus sp. MER TA 171 TaxID=2939577 RepID=UPI00203CC2DC|nr:histidine kinase [Psychrobacillus sp. MER TA 171]MCM3356740.1 histidine kinase [Psychrobacillus sp. MER TA 171]